MSDVASGFILMTSTAFFFRGEKMKLEEYIAHNILHINFHLPVHILKISTFVLNLFLEILMYKLV